MPAEKFDHPFARIAPAWTWERNKTWGLPTFYALVAWLSDMQWTENGQASMLELAIDFELFSGLSMPLHGNAPKGVRERGNVLRCMMSALDKLAAQQGLGSCMRGERVCPTTSLSFMGITGISGIRPRPRFREAHTGTILEEQVKGSDVGTQCPTYPDWTIGRAARWALPAPPQLHPDPVHMPGVGIEKALVTCATHHKGKCEACRALVRRDVPTVEMCCRHHHHANDGQPIAVCTEHSTTKCGECKTAAACCRSGHHACRTHGRGTCQECKRLPTLSRGDRRHVAAAATTSPTSRTSILIQEARGMAEHAALDELDAVYGIIDVATTLLRRRIEARSGKPAQQPPRQQQQQQQQQQPKQQQQQQPRQQQQQQQPKQQQQRPQQQQQQQQPKQQQQQQQPKQQQQRPQQQQQQQQQQQRQQQQQQQHQQQHQQQQQQHQQQQPWWLLRRLAAPRFDPTPEQRRCHVDDAVNGIQLVEGGVLSHPPRLLDQDGRSACWTGGGRGCNMPPVASASA
ncbi:hypothetical protein DIPPA_31818 [Diplonema papillatum]|nr:hypothetical protein DIPPA_31818 [Diplonema papillatum]